MAGNRFLSMLSNRVNIVTCRVSGLCACARTPIVSRFTPAPFESTALAENAIKKKVFGTLIEFKKYLFDYIATIEMRVKIKNSKFKLFSLLIFYKFQFSRLICDGWLFLDRAKIK